VRTRLLALLVVISVFLAGFATGRASFRQDTSRGVSVGSIRKLLGIVEPFGVTGDIAAECRSGGENNAPPTANLLLRLSKADAAKLDAGLVSAGWRRNPPVSGLSVYGQADDTIIRSGMMARITRIGLGC
jgi:hypothetical protein